MTTCVALRNSLSLLPRPERSAAQATTRSPAHSWEAKIGSGCPMTPALPLSSRAGPQTDRCARRGAPVGRAATAVTEQDDPVRTRHREDAPHNFVQ